MKEPLYRVVAHLPPIEKERFLQLCRHMEEKKKERMSTSNVVREALNAFYFVEMIGTI